MASQPNGCRGDVLMSGSLNLHHVALVTYNIEPRQPTTLILLLGLSTEISTKSPIDALVS